MVPQGLLQREGGEKKLFFYSPEKTEALPFAHVSPLKLIILGESGGVQ